MLKDQKREILLMMFFLTGLILTGDFPANAQQVKRQEDSAARAKSMEDVQKADVSITANVTAEELKFEVVANPIVEFTGKPERKTVWESDRRNLPQSVEPGVTYRNIGIQLRIASRFADIERIVAEALGEIPVSDNTPGNKPDEQSLPAATTQKREPQSLNNHNKKPRK